MDAEVIRENNFCHQYRTVCDSSANHNYGQREEGIRVSRANEGQQLPGLFEIRSDVLQQSSFMSSITLIQPITIISLNNINGFIGAFAKLRRASINFVMSVRPHGTTRLPLGGFSRN